MQLQRIALALVMAASVTAACGDDDDSNPSTGGSGGASGGSSGAGGRGGSGGTSGSGGSAGGSGGVSGGAGGSGGSTGGSGGSTGGSGGSVADGGDSAMEAGGGDTVGGSDAAPAGDGGASAMMSFFITSETVTTPNLGGLTMADAKCQRLATAAGVGGKMWKAYLSTSTENARTRIGTGPWYNFKGEQIAASLEELHEEGGRKNKLTQETGLTDKGLIVSGRSTKLPGEGNQHDILTGSMMNGMAAGNLNCSDWTSTQGMKQVGHSDRMGVQADPVVAGSWNSAHSSTCANTADGGGAGRFYCFATN
jgi:hypothetical protein